MTSVGTVERKYDLARMPHRSASDVLWSVAAALTLLLDRYRAGGTVEVVLDDGSRRVPPCPADPDRYLLGGLTHASGAGPASTVVMTPGLELDLAPIALSVDGEGNAPVARVHTVDGRCPPPVGADMVLGHLNVILQAAVDTPERCFGTLDVLTADERRRLLLDWNALEVAYPSTTLHSMFCHQARRGPELPAIIDGAKTVSYAELDVASNRVAHQLQRYISSAGQVIAVNAPRTADTMIAQLAVLKAGAAFMYVDPATPAHRAHLMYDIAAPRAVVSTGGAANTLKSTPELSLQALLDNSDAPDGAPDDIADENTAAYVLFTSGSTGEPKGVVRPHRMQTTRIFLEQQRYALCSRDRHLMKSVPFFREFFWAMATGGAMIVARPGGERDDAYLTELIRAQGITVCSFVPSMLRVLAANPRFREPGLPINHLFVAGEVLDEAFERELRGLGLPVHVTYTLAEADYVCHRSGPPPDDHRGIGTVVGRPIDMRIYLCDDKRRLCPPGFVGECYTGGPGIASGYINRPRLTEDRFITNPFDPERVPILCRTGDLARFRHDGQLEYVGRADGQLKIRGHRVEPSEVERAVREYAAVKNAVVTGLPDGHHGHLLVAYVTCTGGQLDAAALREDVRQRLPAHMVPHYVVVVPDLPLLPSGKVDRAGLTTAVMARPAGLGPPSPPRDDLERSVVTVWRSVLGVRDIGVEDAFTAVGGDSLKAMLLRIALEQELIRPVPLNALMDCPTVREFVEYLEGRND